MAEISDHARSTLDNGLVTDAENGIYRANRSIFTEEEIFELEMKYLFEGN